MKWFLLIAATLASFTSAANSQPKTRLWAYPLSYPEGTVISVSGPNETGEVAGQVRDAKGVYRAFYTGPNGIGFNFLDVPGASSSQASSINDIGQIAGVANFLDGRPDAVFASEAAGQNIHFVDGGGAQLDYVQKINNSGAILTLDFSTYNYYLAYVDGRAATQVKIDGAPSRIYVHDINNRGQLAGSATNVVGAFWRPFVTGLDGRGVKWIALEHGKSSGDFASLNDLGDLVGYQRTDGSSEGTLVKRRATTATVVRPPSGDSLAFTAINNLGIFLGSLQQHGGNRDPRAVIGAFGAQLRDVNKLVVNLPTGTTLTTAWGITDSGKFIAYAYWTGTHFLVCHTENCN